MRFHESIKELGVNAKTLRRWDRRKLLARRTTANLGLLHIRRFITC